MELTIFDTINVSQFKIQFSGQQKTCQTDSVKRKKNPLMILDIDFPCR